MGREVRRVHKDWVHPLNERGHHKGLHENFSKSLANWKEEEQKWNEGFRKNWANDEWVARDEEEMEMTFDDWTGECPEAEDYMPEWPEEERTHLMMYETCSEGTPISPAFEDPEELAQWLEDNGASAFGSMTASKEDWLNTIKMGYAPSAIIEGGRIISGVEATNDKYTPKQSLLEVTSEQ